MHENVISPMHHTNTALHLHVGPRGQAVAVFQVSYSDLVMIQKLINYKPDLEFSRLESWSRDVSRPVFTSLGLGLEPRSLGLGLGLEPRSLGLGLGLEPRSLGLGLGLGTLQSRSRSWSWDLRQWRLGLCHL